MFAERWPPLPGRIAFVSTLERAGGRSAQSFSAWRRSTPQFLDPQNQPVCHRAVVKNRIALCMEYSVHQQGGTEVLVRILAENLGPEYEVVLVTGDTPESFQTSHLSKMVAAH